jgi:hypothetical protein
MQTEVYGGVFPAVFLGLDERATQPENALYMDPVVGKSYPLYKLTKSGAFVLKLSARIFF